MTFDDWWETKPMTFKPTTKAAAKIAWDRATAAERQRCREIALNIGEHGTSDQWFDCADNIACRIGE